jgi:DNA-dependent RNA polymerase auxiliary subunit epsilon
MQDMRRQTTATETLFCRCNTQSQSQTKTKKNAIATEFFNKNKNQHLQNENNTENKSHKEQTLHGRVLCESLCNRFRAIDTDVVAVLQRTHYP